jgi:AcrR family transcriptional regulator
MAVRRRLSLCRRHQGRGIGLSAESRWDSLSTEEERGVPKAPMQEEGRVARRQRRNRDALIRAARDVMTEKGVEAATMLEIAERADVGAGTVYNYFKSKDELAVAVLEALMHDLALRIEIVTNGFSDPAQVYAYGVRTVLDTAITDVRWAQMLNRSEVIADAMFRVMGPFAIRDLRLASQAGRFQTPNPELVWRLTTHALFGASLAITRGHLPASIADQVVVRLLCMTGIDQNAAVELAGRPRPPLAPEAADAAPARRSVRRSPG